MISARKIQNKNPNPLPPTKKQQQTNKKTNSNKTKQHKKSFMLQFATELKKAAQNLRKPTLGPFYFKKILKISILPE